MSFLFFLNRILVVFVATLFGGFFVPFKVLIRQSTSQLVKLLLVIHHLFATVTRYGENIL